MKGAIFMNKVKAKTIGRSIYTWLVKKCFVILFITTGYIATNVFNDGEFFGTTLILGILFLLMNEEEV